jgi:hypothetical protein
VSTEHLLIAASVAGGDAQRILLSSEPYAFRERDVREMKERHGKPVALIDGEWTSWYGVRAIEGLKNLATLRARLAQGRDDDA